LTFAIDYATIRKKEVGFMATNAELKFLQKTTLHDLKRTKKQMAKKFSEEDLAPLNILINKTETAMEAEDVAYVDKKLEELGEL
jgi:hypothetical protein